ncbi:MAG: branched-chain amino acid ABC transporter permease, partial [Planctomycetota bacterium]
GKAMRATAQDRTMASLVGIPINRVITATFVIGSGLAAVAGIMFAMYASVMLFLDGYLPGLKAFTAAVLGGIGNVPGAMVGGFTLGIAENLAMWSGSVTPIYWLVVFAVWMQLVLVLLRRTRGRRPRQVLTAAGASVAVTGLLLLLDLKLEFLFRALEYILGRADYKHVYAFVILMLVLIFRPRGILGERVPDKV